MEVPMSVVGSCGNDRCHDECFASLGGDIICLHQDDTEEERVPGIMSCVATEVVPSAPTTPVLCDSVPFNTEAYCDQPLTATEILDRVTTPLPSSVPDSGLNPDPLATQHMILNSNS